MKTKVLGQAIAIQADVLEFDQVKAIAGTLGLVFLAGLALTDNWAS